MTNMRALESLLRPFMTLRLHSDSDCYVVSELPNFKTSQLFSLLLFRSSLEYIHITAHAKWHFKVYFDDRVSTLNNAPMLAIDFSRLGDYLGPVIAGIHEGRLLLTKGHVS